MDQTDDREALLELHLHGELPAALRERAEAMAATPEGKARIEAMRRSDAEILSRFPVEEISRRIRHRASQAQPRTVSRGAASTAIRWGMGAAATLAMGGVVVVALRIDPANRALVSESRMSTPDRAPTDPNPLLESPAWIRETTKETTVVPRAVSTRQEPAVVASAEVPRDGLRTKGTIARMRVHRVGEDATETVSLRDGDLALAGTILQVALLGGPRVWVGLLSVDGAGQVTRHIPEEGDSSIAATDPVQAPHSFQIDDAPGFERFVLIESVRPFAMSEAQAFLSEVRGEDPLPAHRGWSFQSIRILKPEVRR